MWICVGPRDPPTKPSRGWLWVVVRKPRLVSAEIMATWNKVTAKARAYWRGCVLSQPRASRRRNRVSHGTSFLCPWLVSIKKTAKIR